MDFMRWKHGEPGIVQALVDGPTSIDVGDLLWLNGSTAFPASACDFSDDNAAMFKKHFLGIAMERHVPELNTKRLISVATSGVYEYDLFQPTPLELGGYICATTSLGYTKLHDQIVNVTTSRMRAIGRVWKRSDAPVAKAWVVIRSTIMSGGV
jgi:hypothetical protein